MGCEHGFVAQLKFQFSAMQKEVFCQGPILSASYRGFKHRSIEEYPHVYFPT